jgi:phenylacetate-coenzyme A ligase PaaK-like adenylate-forming protein
MKRPVAWLPFSFFAGKSYKTTLRRKDQIRNAGREELRRYQETELGRMVEFATEQIPAYQEFRSVVSRLSPFEALKAFPFLNKQMLLDDLNHYLPKSFNEIPH